MKLSFVREHLSVKEFSSTELNDFSIITGLNGSGKTQFLKAIEQGDIKVDSIDDRESIYFNYSRFVVDPQLSKDKSKRVNDYNVAQSRKTNYSTLLRTRKNNVINDLENEIEDVYAKKLFPFFTNAREIKSSYIFGKQDQWIDYISSFKGRKNEFSKLNNKLPSSLIRYCLSILNEGYDISILTEKFIEEKLSYLKTRVEEKFEQFYPGFYNSVMINNNEENIFLISEHHFKVSGLFVYELHDEVLTYLIRKAENDLRRGRFEDSGNGSFFSKEEFIDKFGHNPIDFLNEILDIYDCNGYRFFPNDYIPPYGMSRNSMEVPIKLIHNKTGIEVSIEDLSSGEQILLALAMMVYKSRSQGVLPRLLLLDEIDATLHPSMIKKLLSVITDVFIGERNMNVIMTTHSPTTIALAPKESVFILKNDNGLVSISRHSNQQAIEFLTEGFATLESSMDLLSYVTTNKVSIFSEGANIQYLEKANKLFGDEEIRIISGIEHMTGKNQLKTLFEFFKAVKHENKVYFIWDCDIRTEYKEGNNTIPIILEKREETTIKRGIENMFSEGMISKEFYDVKTDDMGANHEIFNKNKFMKHVLEKGTEKDFINFKPIFDRIKKENNL